MQAGGFTETKKDFWEVKIVLENISFSGEKSKIILWESEGVISQGIEALACF